MQLGRSEGEVSSSSPFIKYSSNVTYVGNGGGCEGLKSRNLSFAS